jgi:hypothetical protein
MGRKAEDKDIASGQVTHETYLYLKAFAQARGVTISKVVGEILQDWYQNRRKITPFDDYAHGVAHKLEVTDNLSLNDLIKRVDAHPKQSTRKPRSKAG